MNPGLTFNNHYSSTATACACVIYPIPIFLSNSKKQSLCTENPSRPRLNRSTSGLSAMPMAWVLGESSLVKFMEFTKGIPKELIQNDSLNAAILFVYPTIDIRQLT